MKTTTGGIAIYVQESWGIMGATKRDYMTAQEIKSEIREIVERLIEEQDNYQLRDDLYDLEREYNKNE